MGFCIPCYEMITGFFHSTTSIGLRLQQFIIAITVPATTILADMATTTT